MSTILRALKKLEQDKEALGARGMSRITAAGASAEDRPVGRFGSPMRLLRAAVFVAAFIGVTGVAVYFFFQSRPAPIQAPPSSQSVRKPVRPQAAAPDRRTANRSDSNTLPATPPPAPVIPESQTRRPPVRAPRGDFSGAGTPPIPAQPKRVETREQPEQTQNLPEATPPDAATISGANAAPAGSQGVPAEPARPKGPVPPADPTSKDDSAYANVDRLMDNRLKIQAIVWSPVPDERMAVINSRIVREGSSVEEFSVVAIRSDDVIVREKGQLYRVVFGSP